MDEPLGVGKVGVVVNPKVDGEYFRRLAAALEKRGVEVEKFVEDEPDGSADPDLVFVLGGDGTMLRASRMYPGRVLVGVNLGRVGFMSGILPEQLETGVEKVLDGALHIQDYRMLEVAIDGETRLAVNDAVLLKEVPHQIVTVGVRVDGDDLFEFQCDGFVASTPLGSTAYALSAGGPIVAGNAKCYVLVPIAPHALVGRPLVLGEDQAAELKVVDRGALVSIDGGEPLKVSAGEKVRVRLSEESVRIGRTDEWTWWRAVRRTFL